MIKISRRRFAALAAASLGVTLVGGCAGLQLGMKKPDVAVVNIRLVDGNLLEQRFLLNLRVGSSRVDLQACKLEYSIVSPK